MKRSSKSWKGIAWSIAKMVGMVILKVAAFFLWLICSLLKLIMENIAKALRKYLFPKEY